ncbi:LysM peptidoglycan-binding domain-containing protein [bacterium]|nr:LysM peptidoglycan-binding domain-containing protein [candidate division CSSED10-310 bacterium]
MRSLKQFLVLATTIAIIGVIGLNTGSAEDKTWTYGGVEYRLPKPAQDLQLPGDIPESHTVVSGDCLWSIARTYLNDPYLWPLVWEENLDTIKNPHRIYPGDIVRLPGGGTMIAAEPGGTTAMPARTFTEMKDAEVTDMEEPGETKAMEQTRKPFQVTSEASVIAAGMISRERITGVPIIAAETTAFDLAFDDVIFVEGGPAQGLQQGGSYFIMRELHLVEHPVSGRNLGRMYHVMAEAEILCVNENVTSARISKSYGAVLRGDFLVPREEIPIPLTLGSPPFDQCNPSSKKMPGTIIDAFIGGPAFSDAVILAKGDIAYIDLGSQDGVAPGDYFTIFTREANDPRLPRFVSGEIMVVKVYETTSVVVLTQSKTAVFLGDMIELKQ